MFLSEGAEDSPFSPSPLLPFPPSPVTFIKNFMAVLRLIILVTVLGGLTLLIAQNFSPTLPLIFLGVRTQPFPLAMWILFSVVAGAVTSLFVGSLFSLSSNFALEKPTRSKSSSSRTNASSRQQEPTPRPSSGRSESRSNTNDWDIDGSSDDWDFDEPAKEKSTPRPQTSQVRETQSDERQQEPKTSSKSDSGYSIGYREPQNSGVGKTESIYDADYRVIIPPYQPEPSNPPQTSKPKDEDDDWGLFEDDSNDEDSRK